MMGPNERQVRKIQIDFFPLQVIIDSLVGGVAHLGERLNGIQEVRGSIPLISTTDPVTLVVAGFLVSYDTRMILKFITLLKFSIISCSSEGNK
jgi:hypothetical protein